MENHGFLGPTCVLKVNLRCCEVCPLKVKKKLKQISGVTYIHLDTKKGLVTVCGVADTSRLIKAVEDIGKKAELYKYEMDPKHQHDPNCGKGKHKKGKSDYDDGDIHSHQFKGRGAAVPPNANAANNGNHPPHPHTTMHGPNPYFPGTMPPYPPAARPYYGYEPAHPNPMAYGKAPPPPPPAHNYCPPQPPRRPYTYAGELKHHDGPVGSSIVHTFNDLNTEGYCNIS